MDKKNTIKRDLLRRKIKEYFTKNPSAKSLVVKADLGGAKTIWRVVKEGSAFSIVEVNTLREEFVFEAPVFGSATDPFVQLSILIAQAGMQEFGSSEGRRQFIQKAMPSIAKLQGVEKEKARQLLSHLGFTAQELATALNIKSPGQAQPVSTMSAKPITPPGAMPGSKSLNTGYSRKGKTIKEADEEEKEKKKDKKDEKPTLKKKPAAGLKPSDKIEPSPDPEDEVGIETNTDSQEQQPQTPIKNLSSEEIVVSKTLTGQTIKAASIQLTPNGGELTLELVSAAAPARLEWSKTGKVVFHFNGRPFILKRD